MRVVKVIHGFPPDYMAGSEVYSYHLVKELKNRGIETYVFTRVENEFDESYKIYDEIYDGIDVRRVNKPKRDYLYEDKFYDKNMDMLFREYLLEVKPDIVHIGHLSHLSTNIVNIIKEYKIPMVYTIHDFWLYCIRGQMINYSGDICPEPSIKNCTICSNYMVTRRAVEESFRSMGRVIDSIDIFISPSYTLKDFFISQGVNCDRIKYLKYGFDRDKIRYRRREFTKESKLRFGFMGRVIPTKGIKLLVDTFRELRGETLYIYGAIGVQKRFLESDNIIFKGSYDNNTIDEVLNSIDILIVPSTWYENSPLVIQEAFLAGVPVITSEIGGMAELVKDGVNGFTFRVGDSKDLTRVISMVAENPTILNALESSRDDVVDIADDVSKIIEIYRGLL